MISSVFTGASMRKLVIGPKLALAYLAFYCLTSLIIAPYFFGLYATPLIPASVVNSTSVLDDAIVVNGIILGFVLVVLDSSLKEFRAIGSGHQDYWVRFVVIVIDIFMVLISVLGLFGEMFALVGVSTSLVPQLNKALYLPIGFGVYVGFRFIALALT
jgi:hypothetical protein